MGGCSAPCPGSRSPRRRSPRPSTASRWWARPASPPPSSSRPAGSSCSSGPAPATSRRPSPRSTAPAASTTSGSTPALENGKNILVITVVERPLLASWTVDGASKIPVGTVRDQVKLLVNRPVDRVAIAHGQFAIDSLYRNRGYYSASVTVAGRHRVRRPRGRHLYHRRGPARRRLDGRDRGREGHFQGRRHRQAHGHPARGLLVVAEGCVRRGHAGGGHSRAPAGLVRLEGVHRLPGRGRQPHPRREARQGHAPAHRRRRARSTPWAPST